MSSFHRAEEQDGSKNRWIEDTHQYRREAVEIREQIPSEMVRTPPYRVPELVDYYNRMLHKYVGQLRPKFEFATQPDDAAADGGEVEDYVEVLWNNTIAEVDVPEDGATVNIGEANIHGEIDAAGAIQQLPTEPKPVSLDSLADWRDASVTFDIIYRDRRNGQQRIRRREALYLPVWAADRCLDQLNMCLEDLDWLPDAGEKDVTSAPLMQGGIRHE